MIAWKFYINDVEIEQPAGFNDIAFTIMRDEKWHGVIFEASASVLRFYGDAFDILKALKERYGVDAVAIFRADAKCEGEADYSPAIEGKLNFSSYRETCGKDCFVLMSVEQDNCAMTFKNRMEQKVSVDKNISVDGTVLQNYAGLGITLELATQEIPVSVYGQEAEAGETITPSEFLAGQQSKVAIRPDYSRIFDESIAISELTPAVQVSEDNNPLSPVLLLDDSSLANCFPDAFNYESRTKGSYSFVFGLGVNSVKLVTAYGEYPGSLTILHSETLPFSGSNANGTFDFSYAEALPITPGQGFYIYFEIEAVTPFPLVGSLTFDTETYVKITNVKACPPTDAKVYLVNELLSRVVESITNRCLTVDSKYYGRVDSEPYAQTQDGCGALRSLTNGLRIRQAEEKDFFTSAKDLLEGLNAIDNIGFSIESNPLGDRLRIEPAEYFYQDIEIMQMPLVPEADKQIVQALIRTLIKVGYKKWEIQSVKGIDEFNSNKDFATGIKSINNTLDITSNLIASGYVIDQLRTASLASTGREDSSYDNEVFIICLTRGAYAYQVEQGNIDNPANIFSPETAYNWRIRPMYNLLRWAKSILPAYPILADTASKIFFRSGVGNYEAIGELPAGDPCKLETRILAENDNIGVADSLNNTPIWKPETITFDYPLSIREYNLIKATPHGYISIQCGQGEFIKAYISSINYRPIEGKATLILLLKWQ